MNTLRNRVTSLSIRHRFIQRRLRKRCRMCDSLKIYHINIYRPNDFVAQRLLIDISQKSLQKTIGFEVPIDLINERKPRLQSQLTFLSFLWLPDEEQGLFAILLKTNQPHMQSRRLPWHSLNFHFSQDRIMGQPTPVVQPHWRAACAPMNPRSYALTGPCRQLHVT